MKHDYDRTVTRLITILSKFSHNEIVNPKELAQEFTVSVRTIQKDLKENTQIEFRFEIEKLGRKFNKITFEIKDNYENINKIKTQRKAKRLEGAKTLSQKLKALKIEDVEI